MLKKIDDFASFIDCVTYYSQGLTSLAGSVSTDSDFPGSAVELLENCERIMIARDSKNKLKFFYFFIIENDELEVWFNALTGELQVSTSDEVATTMLPSEVGEAFLEALPKVEDLYTRPEKTSPRKAVKFREVNADLCYKLMQFVSAHNVGQSVVVDGVSYKLHSYNHVAGVSRRLDVYYTVGRSVIRISDVWSKTNYHDRSKKLNFGGLKLAPTDAGNVEAVLLNSSDTTVEFSGFYAGKYPWVLKAGIAGKAQINKFSGLLSN